MKLEICGVLLAAGSSKRFGSDKLRFELPNKELVIYSSAKKLIQVIPNSVAVVQSKNSKICSVLTGLNYHIFENPKYEHGIASSICCAVANTSPDAWVIALADMPFIKLESIHQVVTLLRNGHKLVAPKFNNKRGHPVGISSDYKSDLLELNGDSGAKSIIERNYKNLRTFNTDDIGVIEDIDTLTDIK